MNKNFIKISVAFLLFICLTSVELNSGKQLPSVVKVTFKNLAGDRPVILRDSVYTNYFGEEYTITKLKYYISNICLKNDTQVFKEPESYHLIDESKPGSKSFSFTAETMQYDSITFLIGVDSLHNVSGAQTGALDPVNDMFWTWNSGYVMAKLEGNSSSSPQVNQKFEYHIGGYSGKHNVVKKLSFALTPAIFEAGNTAQIVFSSNLDKWWNNTHQIKISEHAVVTTPGQLAASVSENYKYMFSVRCSK